MKRVCICGVEFETGDVRKRYHDSECGNRARVKKSYLKLKKPVIKEVEGIEVGVLGTSEVLKLDKGSSEEIKPADRNTIRDPNPDWNPDKILSSFNRQMECPICGKLSLTHRKICVTEGRDYKYEDCYNIK